MVSGAGPTYASANNTPTMHVYVFNTPTTVQTRQQRSNTQRANNGEKNNAPTTVQHTTRQQLPKQQRSTFNAPTK
jgi:uncharacterized protein involved in propanediol utilization